MKKKHPVPPQFDDYLQGRLDKGATQAFELAAANNPKWAPHLKHWQQQRQLLFDLRHQQLDDLFNELDQLPDAPHVPPTGTERL